LQTATIAWRWQRGGVDDAFVDGVCEAFLRDAVRVNVTTARTTPAAD
jgi:hypothetical protein